MDFYFVADPPCVTSHPRDLKDAVPGKPVMFTAEATGTEPLSYQWQWKPVMECRKWEPCDVDQFVGADSFLVTIPRVQKSNEGSYRCIITNCAGNQTSNPANLTVGKDPTIRTRL